MVSPSSFWEPDPGFEVGESLPDIESQKFSNALGSTMSNASLIATVPRKLNKDELDDMFSQAAEGVEGLRFLCQLLGPIVEDYQTTAARVLAQLSQVGLAIIENEVEMDELLDPSLMTSEEINARARRQNSYHKLADDILRATETLVRFHIPPIPECACASAVPGQPDVKDTMMGVSTDTPMLGIEDISVPIQSLDVNDYTISSIDPQILESTQTPSTFEPLPNNELPLRVKAIDGNFEPSLHPNSPTLLPSSPLAVSKSTIIIKPPTNNNSRPRGRQSDVKTCPISGCIYKTRNQRDLEAHCGKTHKRARVRCKNEKFGCPSYFTINHNMKAHLKNRCDYGLHDRVVKGEGVNKRAPMKRRKVKPLIGDEVGAAGGGV